MPTCRIRRYGGPNQLRIGELPECTIRRGAHQGACCGVESHRPQAPRRQGQYPATHRMPLILDNELSGGRDIQSG